MAFSVAAEQPVVIFVGDKEHIAVRLAAQDLAGDILRITGLAPRWGWDSTAVNAIVITTYGVGDLPFASPGIIPPAHPEGYVIRSLDLFGTSVLFICGHDFRGTVAGIYHFCEAFLGVDPFYLWTEVAPAPPHGLSWPQISIRSKPSTFRWRGWFINDEDLLTEWRDGGGKRHIDYPFYHQVIHPDVLDKVLETALRAHCNLIIPASFVDILNPPEARLIETAVRRGLYVSQHHVEPLGVSHFAFDNYWAKRGKEIPASYFRFPDEMREVWRVYAREWAKYGDSVIWQLGLRGRGDRAVWVSDTSVGASMEERGDLISRAIADQWDIVREVSGQKRPAATVTMWHEMSVLLAEGHLRIPEGVCLVFSDKGSSKMMQSDFHQTVREPDREYGVYYHIQFWSAGPHLAQCNDMAKMHHNFRQLVERGDTAYAILNVSNIRELVLGIAAGSELMRDFAGFDPKTCVQDWWQKRFPGIDAAQPAELYRKYHQGFLPHPQCQLYQTPSGGFYDEVLLDGVCRRLGLRVLSALEKGDPSSLAEDPRRLLEYFIQGTERSLTMWQGVADELDRVIHSLPADAQRLLDANLGVQLDIMIGLYGWFKALCQSALEMLDGGGESRSHLDEAVRALQKLLNDRRRAENGVWRNWYRGDKKMNLPAVLESTQRVRGDGEK
ncbi:MAG: hypothetical protein GX162_02530 [Firmicutes bacterium]|nr:hypothetical protein [Bacillota bacterium]